MPDLLQLEPNLDPFNVSQLYQVLLKAPSVINISPRLMLCLQPTPFSCFTLPHEGILLSSFFRNEKVATLLPTYLEDLCKLACKVWLIGKREKQSQVICVHASQGVHPTVAIHALLEQFIYLSSSISTHPPQMQGDLLKSHYLLSLLCASPISSTLLIDQMHFQTKLSFDSFGVIHGMHITLLQSLIHFPTNLLVFYILCQSPIPWMKKYLMDSSKFQLLSNVHFPIDLDHFRVFWKCLKTLSIPKPELHAWLKTLIAILHLGNIQFIPNRQKQEGAADVLETGPLLHVADCLNQSPETILNWITTKKKVSESLGDTYTEFLTPLEAMQAKHHCMQALHEGCVRWLIQWINTRVQPSIRSIVTNASVPSGPLETSSAPLPPSSTAPQLDFDIHLLSLPSTSMDPMVMYVSHTWQDHLFHEALVQGKKDHIQAKSNCPELPMFPKKVPSSFPFLFARGEDLDVDVFKLVHPNLCCGLNQFKITHRMQGVQHYPLALFFQPPWTTSLPFFNSVFGLPSLPPLLESTETLLLQLKQVVQTSRLWTCVLLPSSTLSEPLLKHLDLSLFIWLAKYSPSFITSTCSNEQAWLQLEKESNPHFSDHLYRTFFLLHQKKSPPRSFLSSSSSSSAAAAAALTHTHTPTTTTTTNSSSSSPKSHLSSATPSSFMDEEEGGGGDGKGGTEERDESHQGIHPMLPQVSNPSASSKPTSSLVPVKPQLTTTRRRWLCLTWTLTWWIPDCCLSTCGKMKHPDIQLAWREKFTLCLFIFFLSAVMVFFIVGLGKVLCPQTDLLSFLDLQRPTQTTRFVLHGSIYDTSAFQHPETNGFNQSDYYGLKNSDVSMLFPRVDPTTGEYPRVCTGASSNSFFMPLSCTPDVLVKQNKVGYCHNYTSLQQNMFFKIIKFKKVGTYALPLDLIQQKKTSEQMYVMVNKKVYDVTYLVYPDSPLPLKQIQLLKAHAGDDVSSFQSYLNMACLDTVAYIGVVDDRATLQCSIGTYILYVVTYTMVAVMIVKFLSALQLGSKRLPETIDRYVILQVPCYSEGMDSLAKTINSLALTSYKDTHKLLFIVADGMVKGAGNSSPTPDLVLDLLGVQKREAKSFSYLAIGEGSKLHNQGKIYSGLYRIHDHAVPYLVVIKVGTEKETLKAGNRGKRDSQLILMRFMNKVLLKLPMTPMELEMYRHLRYIIGVPPYLYEYVLMVDADTEVGPDCLTRLVATCLNDTKVIGLCGETRIANEKTSWVTMIQVYEYYISHHLAKAFESLFGSVTCLPGCFCMYRFYLHQGQGQGKGQDQDQRVPIVVSDAILQAYSECRVDTLHKKNLLSLGEDRFLTTLLLKTFPQYRMKFTPDSYCYTIVPDTFDVLLSQRRRWINSTIHNLFELLAVTDLCGCLIFSMRFVVFLDLFATLVMPASVAYLGYLIYLVSTDPTSYLQVLILIGITYGMQVIIFLIKRQWQHLGWMIIHILAMPVFYFYIPLYAFWHFDDFSWGNTRRIEGDKGKSGHDNDGDTFDPTLIPVLTWDEYKKVGDPTTTTSTTTNPTTTTLKTATYQTSPSSLTSTSTSPSSLPLPSNEELEQQVIQLLKTSDLNVMTKRKVREVLSFYYKVDLTPKRDLINQVVTNYLKKQRTFSQASLLQPTELETDQAKEKAKEKEKEKDKGTEPVKSEEN